MSNRTAFLTMLSISEGTSTSKATRNNGYDVIVNGYKQPPEVFTDYSDHPFAKGRAPKQVNSKGLKSTASGRYQHLVGDWPHYKALLQLPDFGPESQDKWALQLIKERGALAYIDAGNIAKAIDRCRNIWASLPGAGYGQPEHSLEHLLSVYQKAGGQLA